MAFSPGSSLVSLDMAPFPFPFSQCLTVDLSDNSFLGNVAATCSLAWACSGIFFAGATLQNEDFSPTTGATFGLFIGILVLCGLLCAYGTNVLARLQTPSVILNVVISVATIIGLPIARRGSLNSGAYSASPLPFSTIPAPITNSKRSLLQLLVTLRT